MAVEKWSNEFLQQELNWSQYYQMRFNCTVDVKLRTLNHTYLMRTVPDNKYIFQNVNWHLLYRASFV